VLVIVLARMGLPDEDRKELEALIPETSVQAVERRDLANERRSSDGSELQQDVLRPRKSERRT
jgi:hypothetical protein